MRIMKSIVKYSRMCMAVLLFLSAVLSCLAAGERISLAGTWQLATDSAHYRYTISLPGSTDEAGVGKEHVAGTPLYIGRPETWQLARKRVHIKAILLKIHHLILWGFLIC